MMECRLLWLKHFKGSGILVLLWETLQIFQHPENVKISIIPFTLSQQKCYIFRKYLTNSQKLFFSLKEDEGGNCELTILSAQVF